MKKIFIADVNIKQRTFGVSTHTVRLLDIEGEEIGYFDGIGSTDTAFKNTTLTAIAVYLSNFTCCLPNKPINPRQIIWLVHIN